MTIAIVRDDTGTIRPSWRPWGVGGGLRPIFTCACGESAVLPRSLDGGWQVAADGTVSPSVDCRRVKSDGTPCGFHEFVRLDGWEP